jgi:predicted Fe-Mo cluster-binding NifX family protein
VVTGNCGPKALQVLSAAEIKVFRSDARTVAEALEDFRAGRLVEVGSADADHAGGGARWDQETARDAWA